MKHKYFYKTRDGYINLTYVQNVYFSHCTFDDTYNVCCDMVNDMQIVSSFDSKENALDEVEKIVNAIEAIYENS